MMHYSENTSSALTNDHKVGEKTILQVLQAFQSHKLSFPQVIATKSNCNNGNLASLRRTVSSLAANVF